MVALTHHLGIPPLWHLTPTDISWGSTLDHGMRVVDLMGGGICTSLLPPSGEWRYTQQAPYNMSVVCVHWACGAVGGSRVSGPHFEDSGLGHPG